MAKAYDLIYAREVRDQVVRIERKYHGLIRRTVEERLRHDPEVETRNRKPLARPSVWGEAWELRLGPDNRFRVFYKADRVRREVYILAIGVKVGNRLRIAGEEFAL